MMLAEVHHLAKLTPQQAAYGQSEDIADLLIQIFLHQVNLVLQYGLKRSYIQCQEDLIAVRGRIDLRRTSHLHLIGQAATHCRFEDYTLDAPENRLLLTALRAIEKCDSLSPHRRSLAHRLADEFYGVTATSEVSLDDFPRDRLSSHYYPALPLADLILRSMGIVNEVGVVMADGFLLDMNRLFEEFVRKRLARELGKSGIKVEGQQESWFDTEKQAKIKPDLLITARHGQLVADTKYKVTNDPGPADLYQMLAYCRVLNIDRGILITVGEARNRTFQVRDGETQITVCPIQLHGGIEEIEWSIRSLGRWIKARVAC
jgi:5-methylcytosine-specific restriction enzyme subunit McrC